MDHPTKLSPEESSAQLPQPGMLPRSHTFPRSEAPVPKIVETPPQPEQSSESSESTLPKQGYQFPERSSSQIPPPSGQPQAVPEPPARSSRRPTLDRQAPSSTVQSVPRIHPPSKTLSDIAQHPSPLPGSSARTDTLTVIPTFEDKKPEKKSKKEKDDSEGSSSRKPSWGWFKGSDEKEKKDKKKDDDHKDSKKGKAKASLDKGHDNARLDVLQSTMDTAVPRGRESLLLDRDNIDNKLQDERKKESSRKSGGESKKEKDGIFSSFFGSSKKKSDRDSGGKKGSSLRTLSPDPSYLHLKPDVDYNWTRFSILEERAIYRMAHIKLANPRRALYSQVLLSNFMYSYLAKVQQMHPQIQVPQSALQKKQEAERRQREQEQQYLEEQQQQQRQDSGDPYHYDYHQVSYGSIYLEAIGLTVSRVLHSMRRRSRMWTPKESTMWMIPRSMTTITKMKTFLTGKVDLSHGPPNTIRRTGMWIKASSMGSMWRDITNTAARSRMVMWTMMKMMICGDCWSNCSFLRCFMHILWSYQALLIVGRIEGAKGLCVFFFFWAVLVDINRWKHSVWRSPLRMDHEALQCHFRLLGA
jgi:hypothetical protein